MDRGYLVVITQLPGGASLERTTRIARQVADIALGVPGVARIPTFSGLSGATQTLSSNVAAVIVVLKPFPERIKAGQTAAKIAEEIRKRVAEMRYLGQGHEVEAALPDGRLSHASIAPIGSGMM